MSDDDDCGHHVDEGKELLKNIGFGILIGVLILLFIIFLTWLILMPKNPLFVLQDATVYNFNLSGSPPNLLSTTFQLTINSRNPNDHMSIHYDRLIVYATYRTQQITLPTAIPPTYQDTNGVKLWLPFVTGVLVPIAPYITALNQDESVGNLPLNIKIDGKIRWRVGAINMPGYRLHVDCPAFFAVSTNPHSTTTPLGYNAVKYQLSLNCGVSIKP